MKKIFILPMLILLMNGCAESIALLGTGASNGRIVQSSLNSAISYNVKKQTGKTPLEHAVAYAEKKNPNKKKETCISFIEKTRSEFCTVVKKTTEIVQKLPKLNKIKETSLIEKIAKKSTIYNRR
mgnify:CR=1 FL=1|tara:strand:- start:241 stop:615 length:375 start_codon:yes stop_codon:yes gene_type:complete